MGNRIVGAPGGGLSSTRKSVSAIRYLPAAITTLLLIVMLIAFGSHWGEASWFGLFARGKGAPPVSTTTVLVTADPGAGALDAATLALLTSAILERGPAVVALGPAGAYDSAALETLDSEPLPTGPLVLSHVFARFRPWTFPENGAPGYPPVLSRSLYPAFDGPEPGLSLPMGEGLESSDTAITRGALESGGAGPSTGFAAPLSRKGPAWTLPAFARLERGVTASLGVEAARRALGVPPAKVGYVEGVGALFSASHVLPINAAGEALPRFHAADGIPRIPASRFLEGRVSSTEVRGKLVFVDPAAGAPVATVAGMRSATEAQASLAAGLMEGHLLDAPAWGGTLAVLAGLIFAGVIVVAGLALDFGIGASAALALLLAAFYPAVAYFAFLQSSWWLPPQLPPLMAAAAWIPLALTRRFAPAAPPRSPSIQPASGYDPSLVPLPNHGRAAGQSPTPPRGTPQVSAAPAAHSDFAAHPEPIAPAYPQAQPGRPRPVPPRERQGAPLAGGEPRYSDPRDPPIVPSAVDLRPAATAPAPRNAPAPAAPPPGPGEDIERDAKGGLVRVGKYRIVRKMGFGSAGDVFEGFDTRMGRKVAIKTITKNAAALFDRAADRFVLEAKAAGSLNHPCINTIYDFGTIREVSYMVLEYLDGITLSQWMRSNPQPPHPRAVAHWLQQMASALDYAHDNKIIHRDLKPSNLMVVNNGSTMKLLDFGIAKMDDVGLTQTGMTVGTPSYMSPEQLSGIKVGPASDQYAFAVVTYQLLTYKLPYIGTKIPELCNRILKNEIVPIGEVNPSLGGPFWETLRKAMSKTPEERYPNCLSLCASLVEVMPN